jgi:hypothetical protein
MGWNPVGIGGLQQLYPIGFASAIKTKKATQCGIHRQYSHDPRNTGDFPETPLKGVPAQILMQFACFCPNRT